MSLTLYSHPLASYCWKALIALYENETPFVPHHLDLMDARVRDQFRALWPLGKMPVLRDDANDRTIPEATIIIEYLSVHHPGPTELVPREAELAREVRLHDRIFDLYVHEPMQRIVGDRNRPSGAKDPYGVEQAHAQLRAAYDLLEPKLAGRTWAIGESFTLADCAAAPALFYANEVDPVGETRPNLAAYLERLFARPSIRRTREEAEPFMHFFPRR
jgi:glutathione S-transferase